MQHDRTRSILETLRRRIDDHFRGERLQIGFGADAVVDLRGLLDLRDQPLGIVRAERLETLRILTIIVDGLGSVDGIAVARLPIDIVNAQHDALLLELLDRPRALAAGFGAHVRRGQIGPVVAQRGIFARTAVVHPSDRNTGRPRIGER